ncbi:MAG: hypothetical protein JWR01_2928 [Subtercola sp.]|nr:hypothetical protein [Subtercola sp.]
MKEPGNPLADDLRKIRKFVRRADMALAGPVWDLGEDAFTMRLVTTLDEVTREPISVDLVKPAVPERELKATIADCRVFFMPSEDSYMPGVVKALRRQVAPDLAERLQPLADRVDQVIEGKNLRGAHGYSGRLEMDNGFGPGKLLSSSQIAMDYIYGHALHEDEVRISRLENVSGSDAVQHSVLTHLAELMKVVGNVRDQIRFSAGNGALVIDL